MAMCGVIIKGAIVVKGVELFSTFSLFSCPLNYRHVHTAKFWEWQLHLNAGEINVLSVQNVRLSNENFIANHSMRNCMLYRYYIWFETYLANVKKSMFYIV